MIANLPLWHCLSKVSASPYPANLVIGFGSGGGDILSLDNFSVPAEVDEAIGDGYNCVFFGCLMISFR